MADIYRMSYYLIIAMMMSMMWGIFVLMVGLVLRHGIGQLIESYVQDVDDDVNLKGTINEVGVNICPVETAPGNNIDLGEWSTTIGSIVTIAGGLIIMYSLTGFGAAIFHSAILLLLLLLIIAGVYCVEYYILQLIANSENTFHMDAKSQLLSLLHREYSLKDKVNLFTGTINAIMLKAQCCGIRGWKDFLNLTFDDQEQKVDFVVSPACCKKSLFSSRPDETFSRLKDCARTGHAHLINQIGCYSAVYQYVAINYGTLIIIGISALAVWQFFQVVFILILLFKSPKEDKPKTNKDFHKIMIDQVNQKKPVQFVPYWKTSSYVHEDLQRIRSTEIW